MADAPLSTNTSLFTRTASSLTEGGRWTGIATSRSKIVELAVAVVIFAVADLRLWQDCALTGAPLLVGAYLCSCAARTYALGRFGAGVTLLCLTVFAGAAVVNEAIAVIVLVVVAGLCILGYHFTLTGAPKAILADLCARLALAHTAGSGLAAVTHTNLTVVIARTVATVGDHCALFEALTDTSKRRFTHHTVRAVTLILAGIVAVLQ